jgi:chromosomal replication initiation ATPase DnaA
MQTSTVQSYLPSRPAWSPGMLSDPKLAEVMRVVASDFDVTVDQMMKSSRGYDVWKPRMAAMYCARMVTTASLPQLGRAFGGRSHTTVLRAVTRCRELMAHDPRWADRMMTLVTRLIEPAPAT